MAKNFGARQDSKYEIISSAPSVNKTQVGNSVVPIPYPVSQKYDAAASHSKDVNFNGKPAFLKSSNSTEVKGDEQGKKGGVKSGTVNALAEPIVSSTSVTINKEKVIRDGDLHEMQGGNTIGKLTTTESGDSISIKDNGAIEGDTLPPDLDQSSARAALSPKPIASPLASSCSKPTASSSSGGLGSATGSPVVLKTAQLSYTQETLKLHSNVELSLNITYLSNEPYKGMFGNSWRYVYEKEFVETSTDMYRLYLEDAKKFDFSLKEQKFTDLGNLGVEVLKVAKHNYILTYKDLKKETYYKGKLICIEDKNSNTLTLSYDDKGRLHRVTSSDASYFEFFYNKESLVHKVQDSARRVWEYSYDEHRNLRTLTDPIKATTSYKYNVAGLLVEVEDALGNTLLGAEYTQDKKILSYRDKEQKFTYTYLSSSMITKEEEYGETTHYGLDEHGLIRAITYADASTTKEDYNPQTREATTIDRGGNISVKTFDEKARLIKEIDHDKKETLYTYEGSNPEPISILRDEQETTFTYDKRYNLLSMSKNGNSQSFKYDDKGNTTSIIDALGNETTIEYNNISHPISYTDANSHTTLFTYDEAGRQTTLTDAQGNISHTKYNEVDDILSTTDADGSVIKFKYDVLARLISVTDTMSNTTSYNYDKHSRVISQLRSDKREKHFSYNRDNTIKSITHEDSTTTSYTYNKAKLPIEMNSNGQVSRYEYDSLGNMLSASDNSSDITYTYNSHANVVLEKQMGIEIDKSFHRDTQELLRLKFLDKELTYQRDANSNITCIKTYYDAINLEYDKNSIVEKRLYPNKESETLEYDKNYNTLKLQSASQEFNYSHNEVGELISTNNTEFSYDTTGRLIQSDKELFSYDRAGNNLHNSSEYNPNNYQLLHNDEYTFSYDLRGNLVSKKSKVDSRTTHYSYNAKNLLSHVVVKESNQEVSKELTFTYDALNRRVSKCEDTIQHYYLYDGMNIIAILDESRELLATIVHEESIDTPLSITNHRELKSTENILKEFNQADKIIYESATQEEKEYFLNLKRTPTTYYYHRDHQGSIIALTDKDANIVESFIYDESYGKILQHETTIQTLNPYAYTGREFDMDDLYYYRARYYDPQTQRFLSEDPIEFMSGDFNWYRYVGNSPLNYVDPFGFNRCKSIERKMKKIMTKGIAPLKKLAAKQVAKMAFVTVPFAGWAMAAWTAYDLVNIASDISGLVDEYDALDKALSACTKKKSETKKAQNTGSGGSKVKGKKLKKKKVKCFCPKDKAKGGRPEYDKQLKAQQDGINNMSADDYLKNRESFTGKKLCGKTNSNGNPTEDTTAGQTSKRKPKVTKTARKERLTQQKKKYTKEIKSKGYSKDDSKRFGKAKAKRELAGQDATHNADMIAGGNDIISQNSLGFGDSYVNRDIGRNWKGGRVGDMDTQACEAKKNGNGKEKMNVELRACGKKEAKKAGCHKKK
jgi:RHS repeat-associated protein